MKLQLSFWLSHILLNVSLGAIFVWQAIKNGWDSRNKSQFIFSPKPHVKTLHSLNSWSKDMEKPMQPNVANYTEYLDRCQTMLRTKWLRIDGLYYDIIDELLEKIKDLELAEEWKRNPDLKLRDFTFISDWEAGIITSQEVLNILEKWDNEEVAHLAVTRRLSNYMFRCDEARDYVKHTIQKVKDAILPEYIKYLDLMRRFFTKAAECDMKQLELTWIEITLEKDGAYKSSAQELTLNQTLRQIDTYVKKYIENGFALGENIVCLDEGIDSNGTSRQHWIFAPKAYAYLLREMYNAKETMTFKEDGDYLKRIIGVYFNAK